MIHRRLLFRLDLPFLDDVVINVVFGLDLLSEFFRRVADDNRRESGALGGSKK
jgi:hypothetical protein